MAAADGRGVPLTAGKVENLRIAAQAFHEVEIPAGEIMAFWRQLGRTTRRKGYQTERELREGCIVPAVGGGLCQLSGLLYQAALEAGLEIIERHGHSRVVPGSDAERDLDATVFWNYVDLRFRHDRAWRIEVELTAADLVVRIRAPKHAPADKPAEAVRPKVARPLPSGDCLTCGMVQCFRHPSATDAPALGHSAFLLDSRWPEFDQWCSEHARPGDAWFTPMDGWKWKKPNYQWTIPENAPASHGTIAALHRSFRQRRLPAQGALRQNGLIAGERQIAESYARNLDPKCRHVVVSQNLLPHLWRLGALGGRSFDVLIERWPLAELQRRLDRAKSRNPQSATLADFRADPELARAEKQALAAAGRLITPHLEIAKHLGSSAWNIPWTMPKPVTHRAPMDKPSLFLPASRLGRKGAFELADALSAHSEVTLKYLGRATEGDADPFDGIDGSPASLEDLARTFALVLPAWIEHQPRLALLALASGIPVIATKACGLPEHPRLHQMEEPDTTALVAAIHSVLAARQQPCAT